MNRVVVVEDETMARKGIILTIDWSALGCVIVGKLPMEKRGGTGGAPFAGYCGDGCEDAPHGWRGDDREAAGKWLPDKVYHPDSLQ